MRYKYLDFLKLFSCFIIYATHFIAQFHKEYFNFWKIPPTKYLLEGISGKLGVAVFGAILGYLAYKQGREGKRTIAEYFVRRYFYFVVCGLVINSIYKFAGMAGLIELSVNWKTVIYTSLCLGDTIFPTFWCMPAFFAASVLCYSIGKSKWGGVEIVITILMLMYLRQLWIAICVLGSLSEFLTSLNLRILQKRGVRIALWIMMFILVKRSESYWTYFIDGLIACCLLLVINSGTVIQKMCDNPVSNVGMKSIGIFLIHPITYSVVGPYFFQLFAKLPYGVNFACSLVSCFILIVVLAYPLTWGINMISNGIWRAWNFGARNIYKGICFYGEKMI